MWRSWALVVMILSAHGINASDQAREVYDTHKLKIEGLARTTIDKSRNWFDKILEPWMELDTAEGRSCTLELAIVLTVLTFGVSMSFLIWMKQQERSTVKDYNDYSRALYLAVSKHRMQKSPLSQMRVDNILNEARRNQKANFTLMYWQATMQYIFLLSLASLVGLGYLLHKHRDALHFPCSLSVPPPPMAYGLPVVAAVAYLLLVPTKFTKFGGEMFVHESDPMFRHHLDDASKDPASSGETSKRDTEQQQKKK